MKKRLRIAINAQIIPGTGAGGIETVVRFLTSVGRLDSDEEYVFVGHADDETDWLKPFLNDRQRWVRAPRREVPPEKGKAEKLKSLLGPARSLARGLKSIFIQQAAERPAIPDSNGFFESLNCDVIHFPYQDFVRTAVPSIYNPHDLQHLHFPQYFPPEEYRRREMIYPAACRDAQIVIAASQFIKQDIVDKYGIEPSKIQVITWGPPETTVRNFTVHEARALREKYGCPPDPFALYPAVTWEHKNHLRLLEAIALLRDREGVRINLVCTGHKNGFYPKIEQRINELQLEQQVRFVGVVESEELSMLYRRAQFVIIPTLFEAASAPLLEAWQHDVAVACSAIPSLVEQADGAGLLFDPLSIEAIAGALKALVSDQALRSDIRSLGRARFNSFDPDRTAKSYRAVYRRAAGIGLTDEDLNLLNGAAGSLD